jgi:hypothetical protein
MRLLVSGATTTIRRYQDSPHLGVLLVPGAGNSISSVLATGLPWTADNAAFSGFDPAAFCSLIGRAAGRSGCLFVACPDVVGDAAAKLRLFARWQPVLASLDLPVALVAQDGAENLELPWGRFQALFIGGSTQWKLGGGAAGLVAEAKRRGLWVHLGRCNTRKRFRHAFLLACDSLDGSGFSRWPDERIPAALRWLADLHGTPAPATPDDVTRCFRQAAEETTPALLDRPGWVIAGVTLQEGAYLVRARFATEPVTCPGCGVPACGTVYRHGIRTQILRDVPRHGRPVRIRVERRRYRCSACGITFLQALPGLRGRSPVSEELARHVGRLARAEPRIRIAQASGLAEKTVRNLLATFGEATERQ